MRQPLQVLEGFEQLPLIRADYIIDAVCKEKPAIIWRDGYLRFLNNLAVKIDKHVRRKSLHIRVCLFALSPEGNYLPMRAVAAFLPGSAQLNPWENQCSQLGGSELL